VTRQSRLGFAKIIWSHTIAVADAGFEGYKSIISVEFVLKIAVAVNATSKLVNKFSTYAIESTSYRKIAELGV
jgi:hypothetical protein